jgi:hypothetical protein
MKKLGTGVVIVGLLATLSWSVFAGAELDEVNAEVDKQSEDMDRDYGVLLTGQERNNLKLSLVVARVIGEKENNSVAEKTTKAIKIYEINDPVDQRVVLIGIGTLDDGDGLQPPK